MNILDNYFRKFHVLFILKFKFSYGLVIFLLLTSFSAVSQTFDRLNTQNLKGGHLGFSSFVDYNNDGFLDIFVTGVDFDNRFNNAVFYNNNGDLSFTESNITNIPRVIYGDHSWGDFDNNGTQDLLYTGTTSGGADYTITKVYKNSKNGCEFIEIPLGLPGIYTGSSKWVDIDSDGLLDIYLSGFDVSGVAIITAYKNEGDDTFTKQDISTLDGVLGGRGNFTRNKSRWEDFDNDGLQDLIIAVSSKTDKSFDVYKNLGNFQFS
ncbi:FG-GAP repeat domain-containing protein [Algibacter miyuki]|uniref:FG-GAP repeat domain-containing protein n=1 Tax=Algibacter miyuki TaxID=1306933 RepID=A0ABV5GZV8_9FLAO|nr:VCBS repeat-containing protein [Algibacter miyuki]MDN3667016.1 VCBS repeat-containing protein [Algibacter miyuki]